MKLISLGTVFDCNSYTISNPHLVNKKEKEEEQQQQEEEEEEEEKM
jgi:hypothetical protein